MKIKIFPSFVLILILWACSQNKNSVKLTEDDSVWVMKTKDFLTAKDLMDMRLIFKKNGYAYEENTILKYPYKIYDNADIFELNHHRYHIIKIWPKKLIMKNAESGIDVILYKE